MSYIRSVIRVSSPALRFHGVGRFSTASPLPGGGNTSLISIVNCDRFYSSSANPKSNEDDGCQYSSSANPKSNEDDGVVLRPGMVLLKSFLTGQEQVSMLSKCKNILSTPWPAGGMTYNWDPQKRKFGEPRRDDDSQPLFKMPHEFQVGVINAISVARCLIQSKYHASTHVEDILPSMSPDYGFLQFRPPGINPPQVLRRADSERYESLSDGLPIVSFSFGDSSEFFYGDCRDTIEAKKLVLESGDALVFGGPSRLIFHDHGSVFPGTAPKHFIDNSGLFPGRYNLSFSEF